jgi:CRP-like cAMP-binding protein
MNKITTYFRQVNESTDSNNQIGGIMWRISQSPNLSIIEMRNMIEQELRRLKKKLEEKLLVEIIALKQGMSFGELALNNNQPRAATIVCKTDCHFAVMIKADYQKCLLAVTKRRIQHILEFL